MHFRVLYYKNAHHISLRVKFKGAITELHGPNAVLHGGE